MKSQVFCVRLLLRQLLRLSLVVLLLAGWAFESTAADKLYYRYTNSEGVRVIRHAIPPEYVQKGYEVVTVSGKLIKRVAPAVDAQTAAKQEAQRQRQAQLDEWDTLLKRRYSSVADIEAAKQRKLSVIDNSVAILRTNISSLQNQIVAQQAQAANIERKGRKVPEKLLKNIVNLQTEQRETEQLLLLRREEHRQAAEKFDRDITRFELIKPR